MGELNDLSAFEARYQYGKSLNKGVIKVMSKMGVSTVASYVGSQLFEPSECPTTFSSDTSWFHSRLGGITLEHVARDVLRMHASAFDTESQRVEITNHGEYQWRATESFTCSIPAPSKSFSTRRGEAFRSLQAVLRSGGRAEHRKSHAALAPQPRSEQDSSALDEVESVSSIVKRFSSGAMSMARSQKRRTPRWPLR